MKNGLTRLNEVFPGNHYKIALELGTAIMCDDQNTVSQIISKYFSKAETVDLLNGAIAIYEGDEEMHLPACLAAAANKKNILELILKATNNPNARIDPDNPENTPTLLIDTVMAGNIHIVELLLEWGANPNDVYFSTTEDGKRVNSGDALSWAVRKGLTNTADLLLNFDVIPSRESAIAAIGNVGLDPYLVKIIQLRPELLHDQINGVTLLHMAALEGNLPAIKWLMEQGCDVNAKDVDGGTPTDWAENEKEATEFFRSIGGVSGVLNASHTTASHATPKKSEITNIVERLELLEDKFDIVISGLYASCESRPHVSPPDHVVRINFDVNSAAGGELERSLKINASTYNTAGQLLSTEKAYITKENFIGFESKEMIFFVDQAPTKIRLFPAAYD